MKNISRMKKSEISRKRITGSVLISHFLKRTPQNHNQLRKPNKKGFCVIGINIRKFFACFGLS